MRVRIESLAVVDPHKNWYVTSMSCNKCCRLPCHGNCVGDTTVPTPFSAFSLNLGYLVGFFLGFFTRLPFDRDVDERAILALLWCLILLVGSSHSHLHAIRWSELGGCRTTFPFVAVTSLGADRAAQPTISTTVSGEP